MPFERAAARRFPVWPQRWLLPVVAGVLLAGAPGAGVGTGRAQALLPGYALHRWTLADGTPPDIRAIAQTPDGYLWLGTGDGLFRFDGLGFTRIAPEDFDRNRARQITALAVARDGALWVGYAFGGTAVLRDGVLRGFNPEPHPRGVVTGLEASADGGMWVAAWSGYGSQLRRYAHGRWSAIEANAAMDGGSLQQIHLARDGTLWIAAYPHIYRMAPGSTAPVVVPGPMNLGPAFAEDAQGRAWLYTSDGLFRLGPQGAAPTGTRLGPMIRGTEGTRTLLAAPDNALWIAGDAAGLETLQPDETGRLAAQAWPLRLTALFRDREGTIWGGGAEGLYRFVRSPVVALDGLGDVRTGFAAGPQGLYVGVGDGLYRIRDGKARRVLSSTLVSDVCAVPGVGAYVFTAKGEFLVRGDRPERIIGPREKDHFVGLGCTADAQGTVWQAISGDGVYRLAGRRWQRVAALPSLSNFVATGADSFVVSRPFKLVARVAQGHTTPIWPEGEVAVGLVRLLAPMDGAIWIGGEAGLARSRGGQVSVLSARTYPWAAGVMGMVRQGGDYWLISSSGILRIAVGELERALAQPGAPVRFTRFGGDGSARARTDAYIANDAAIDAQGQLWFVTSTGVVRLDPSRIAPAPAAMPVQIIGIDVDGRAYPLRGAQLPAGTTRVGLTYVGLGLANAETNRYRYRLEGGDPDWVEAGTRRRVDFAGLGPGTYRFHVAAATQDGPWPTQDAALSFTIAPHVWQTGWFRLAALLAALVAGYALLRWRLALVLRAQRDRIEARVAERERIARDLHDTLLQGFQGLMLRFQSILLLTPADSPAHAAIEEALERADDVLLEGRERVRGLREDSAPKDIAAVLRACAPRATGGALAWHLQVDGPEQPVSAPVAEELALAVGEALANAARHARATQVCIEIHHGRDRLAVRVVDDGSGLPEAVRAAGGRAGHYGLSGMRERIERLGGSVHIGNAAGGGTSVRFSLPGRIAYR